MMMKKNSKKAQTKVIMGFVILVALLVIGFIFIKKIRDDGSTVATLAQCDSLCTSTPIFDSSGIKRDVDKGICIPSCEEDTMKKLPGKLGDCKEPPGSVCCCLYS